MDDKDISRIEGVLGYKFSNKALLIQAFTRSSFSNNPKRRDSEVLEFIGDRVIEYQITRMLVKVSMSIDNKNLSSKYTSGELTILKSLIVENENFVSIIEEFGLDQYIRIGQNETIQKSFKSDLLESIVGAIAVDSNFNDEKLYEIIDNLLSPRAYIRHFGFDSFLYIKRWCKIKKVKGLSHSISLIKTNGTKSYKTTIKFGDYEVNGIYEKKIDSLLEVANLAYKKIRDNKEEITVRDFLNDLTEYNSKSKLDELRKLDYINYLEVNNEKPIDNKWKITFQTKGYSITYMDSSKKKAVNICALMCINDLLTNSHEIDSCVEPLLTKLGYEHY